MSNCSGCDRPAALTAEVHACDDCRHVLSGFIAAMKPGSLSPVGKALSPKRKALLLRLQLMTRRFADASIAFADTGIPDSKLEKASETVERAWALLNEETWSKKSKPEDWLN